MFHICNFLSTFGYFQIKSTFVYDNDLAAQWLESVEELPLEISVVTKTKHSFYKKGRYYSTNRFLL